MSSRPLSEIGDTELYSMLLDAVNPHPLRDQAKIDLVAEIANRYAEAKKLALDAIDAHRKLGEQLTEIRDEVDAMVGS